MCMQFDVTRPFYVVVEAPGSAFRGEQLGVQIALYNYWSQSLEVTSQFCVVVPCTDHKCVVTCDVTVFFG